MSDDNPYIADPVIHNDVPDHTEALRLQDIHRRICACLETGTTHSGKVGSNYETYLTLDRGVPDGCNSSS